MVSVISAVKKGGAGTALQPEFVAEEGRDGGEGDAVLLAGVAVADGDGLVRERVAVDGEAEGGAGLVLGEGVDASGTGAWITPRRVAAC